MNQNFFYKKIIHIIKIVKQRAPNKPLPPPFNIILNNDGANKDNEHYFFTVLTKPKQQDHEIINLKKIFLDKDFNKPHPNHYINQEKKLLKDVKALFLQQNKKNRITKT